MLAPQAITHNGSLIINRRIVVQRVNLRFFLIASIKDFGVFKIS